MASSNNLGTLTIDLIANTGGYTSPLEQAERLTKKAMKEMGMAVDEFGNYTDKALRKAAEASKQLDASYERLAEDMRRQIALYGDVTRAMTLRYDLERGALKNLSAEQKRSLTEMANRLDAMDSASDTFRKNTQAAEQAGGAYRGLRGAATGLGYQIQDIAVQLQQGTNGLMVFAQQGSQIASLLGPWGALAGAAIAIGGALAGSLIPGMLNTADSAEEVSSRVAELVQELDNLNQEQQKIVQQAQQLQINQQQKAIEEQTKAIEAQRKAIADLNAENGKLRYVPTGGGTLSGAGLGTQVAVDNTKKIKDATDELIVAQTKLVELERQLADLRDPKNITGLLKDLEEQAKLAGLTGRALYEQEAALKGLLGVEAERYVQLKLEIDAKNEALKLSEKKDKTDEKAAAKQLEAEQKLIANIQRQIDLYGVTSKAAQMEYDITKGIVEVKGGLESVNARLLIQGAARLDQLDAEKRLNDALNIEIDQTIEAQIKAEKDAHKARERFANEAAERIDTAFSQAWVNAANGADDLFSGVAKGFKQMLAEMAHEAVTRPIVLNIQQKLTQMSGGESSSNAQGAGTAIGAGGLWGAIAVAVIAGVGEWNKRQEEKFAEMTSAYRQGTQSTNTLLGQANQKSDSINQSIQGLQDFADDTLGVNRGMLQALLDIRSGVAGVASGFARQISLTGGVGVSGIGAMGTSTFGGIHTQATRLEGFMNRFSAGGGIVEAGGAIGEFVTGFTAGITDKVTKALYNKKTKIIDSGIQFAGQSLADILSTGAIEAFAYADIQTKKKVLGITTSNKVKTQTEDLSDILLGQFADVFSGAGDALSQAADIFGLDFQNYISSFVVDPQKLSLKGLEGDELTKEIEGFFSSTLDNWAGVLVDGRGVLEKFQQVGEGAFETVIRLASELNSFTFYTGLLDLNFKATGFSAVEASQNIASFAGGIEKLTGSLNTYYSEFFTEQEQAQKQMGLLTEEFNRLGFDTVPASREAFRALIEGLDLTVAKDQELFAELINLSGAFAELVPWSEDAAGGIEDLTKALKDAAQASFDMLARSIDAEKARIEGIVDRASSAKNALDDAISREKSAASEAYDARIKVIEDERSARDKQLKDEYSARESAIKQALKAEEEAAKAAKKAREEAIKNQIKLAEDSIKNLSSIFDTLVEGIKDLALQSDDLTRMNRRAAEFEIETAIRNAQAGRGLPSAEVIQNAVSTLVNNPTSLYSSFAEMAYATAVTQNKLSQLADLTQGQLTEEQQKAALLEAQLAASEAIVVDSAKYDKQLTEEKERYDASAAAEQERFDKLLSDEKSRYEGQIAALDLMSEEARKQFDKLTGIDTSLLSLDEAQKLFQEALLAADFENAQQQLGVLDSIEKNARAQLDALLGIESGIMAVGDALTRFNESVRVANEKIQSAALNNAQSTMAKTNEQLLAEIQALKAESGEANEALFKETRDGTDILRQMYEDQVSV